MLASAVLRVMFYGKWHERFGGEPAPYEFVELYDSEAGELFTWSLDEALKGDRPAPNTEAVIEFSIRKQAKPAETTIKKGDRKGETVGYVQEKLKVKVVGFRPEQAKAQAKAA